MAAEPNSRDAEAPVGNPHASPARPSGLDGLKSYNANRPDVPRWFAFWKYNFCIRENTNFGTWDGVFPACLAHLLNVIVFLRTGYIVAKAGVLLSITISVMCLLFAAVTVLSAVGILRRSSVECRNIYQLLAVTLGTRASTCIGLIYAFTHAVSCSLHVMGMGELIVGVYYDANDHDWAVRGVACCFLLLLTFLNASGIRWIIRAQYVIIILMALGVGDFVVGAFFRRIPERGIEGPSRELLQENLYNEFSSWRDYFRSVGIFFPSAVGVLVGFNIASDLRDPHRSIPKGTFAALFCSFWVHLIFILLLGMCVLRSFLLEHPHTAVRMAAVQVFIIAAIFVSSFSAGMGALFNASRILARVGKEIGIRWIKILGWEWERYDTPLVALSIIFGIAFLFVLIGHINFLAPIITTSHFLTFATINYAYFAVSTTYKIQMDREQQATTEWLQQGLREGRIASPESRSPKVRSPEAYGTMSHSSSIGSERSHLLGGGSLVTTPREPLLPPKLASPVLSKPEDWYMKLLNRWVSLFTAVTMGILAFVIQWESALSVASLLGLLYISLQFLSPKSAPGIVEFHPLDWLLARFGSHPPGHLAEESSEETSVSVPEHRSTASFPTRSPQTDKAPFLP